MRETDPFRELLESLEEEVWPAGEEEKLEDEGGGGSGGDNRRFGGGRGNGSGRGPSQGNPRMLWLVIIPFLIIFLFNWGLGFITDWQWYQSLSLQSVFWTRISASVGLFVAG